MTTTTTQARDSSGFAFFSDGGLGAAHATAHTLLDAGRLAEGRRVLGAYLDASLAAGEEADRDETSRRLHLHWHQLVFEIGTGDVAEAFDRFRRHLLVAAATSSAVLTDAPSAMWRLRRASREGLALPWFVVRDRALENLGHDDRYVELHNFLALAGAGDVAALDRRLGAGIADELLRDLARGLRAVAAGDDDRAATVLGAATPFVSALGGSRGQNDLFVDPAADAAQRSLRAA